MNNALPEFKKNFRVTVRRKPFYIDWNVRLTTVPTSYNSIVLDLIF